MVQFLISIYKDTNKRGQCQIYLNIAEREYLKRSGDRKGTDGSKTESQALRTPASRQPLPRPVPPILRRIARPLSSESNNASPMPHSSVIPMPAGRYPSCNAASDGK